VPTRRRSTKLKVVTLVDDIGVSGGGEKLARELMIRLDSNRFERILCVSRWSPARESDPYVARALRGLDDAGVHFLGLRRSGPLQLWSWRPLISLLRNESVHILHSHKFGSNVWGGLLAPLGRVPVFVAQEHTWSFEGRPLRRLLDRDLVSRRASVFIAVSRLDRQRMIEVEGIDPDRIVVIPSVAPIREPTRDRQTMRRELGLAEQDQVIGAVCALRPQKALGVLIEAVARLKLSFPHARLVIVGDGPERASLEALVRRRHLESTVRLLGTREDPENVLQAIDIGALSSDYEGTPLSVTEYMAAAKPVVATRVGGVPDLVDDGVHGLLVEPRDHNQLADALAQLLRDPRRAHRMGQAGQQRRAREFDINATVRRLESLYLQLEGGLTTGQRAESPGKQPRQP
jgi:glycosyltransferase involved in cell wall biosynthesis